MTTPFSHIPFPDTLMIQPPDHDTPLFVPPRSRHVELADWVTLSDPIPETWLEAACAKGFTIDRRIRDRYHVVLTCKSCGAQTVAKAYTLMSGQPRCGGCALQTIEAKAEAAGLTFLRRDPDHHAYGIYRASCGHELRRQYKLVDRAAAGKTGIRCGTCLAALEDEEACRQGWERVGPDPEGDPNYRLYRHGCGHEQRIARTNMHWGQCDCASCGSGWSARPSQIYLAQISLPETGLRVVKLGYSGNPEKRFRHQLGLPPSAEVEILRLLPMPTGHDACAAERRANTALVRAHPDAVIQPEVYAGQINVVSEIYCPSILPRIHGLMDEIAADVAGDGAEAGERIDPDAGTQIPARPLRKTD
ncbi:hypothetical protein KUV65_06755 [Maritalea mobilis]|uniref:hypothetical protein n=1 Tax=Maritalea mobilis TaxID=483324 RepID=UPI001C98C268|nr:hypothetical protein [Maritalea mobilis]MBY6201054.1 hypothetical protein [Maritalea mobilis]